MKIITIPNDIKEIKETLNFVHGYIIGIKDLSVNMNFDTTLDNLKEIDNLLFENNKELFIALNKNMHNSDMPYLKDVLLTLNSFHIKAVMFYDVSVLNLYKKLNLNYELIFGQEHFTTNYLTINYFKDYGASFSLISGEITLDEIIEIKKNTNVKLIVPIFGYLPMYVSKRRNVKNYLDYFEKEDDSLVNYMYKENTFYPIIDKKIGTSIYSGHILNGLDGINALEKNKIDYVLLNSFNIPLEKFIKVLEIYRNVNKDNIDLLNKSLDEMFNNLDTGFLWKKTISKVKKNEKNS